MKTLKRFVLSLATLMLFTGVAMVTPAAATDKSTSGDSSSSSSSDSSSGSTTDATENTSDSGANSLANQFKQQAEEKLHLIRQGQQLHSEVIRQKSCDARKASLTIRMSDAVRQAKKHKAVFDAIYSRVKQFYTNKNLNVTNYTSLTAAVDSAQADAQTKLDALAALNVTVDCNSQTVADSISAFQQAETAARDALKAYRTALTSLISSIKGASTSTNHSSTTNQTGQ